MPMNVYSYTWGFLIKGYPRLSVGDLYLASWLETVPRVSERRYGEETQCRGVPGVFGLL
jgi:hypothetical protein